MNCNCRHNAFPLVFSVAKGSLFACSKYKEVKSNGRILNLFSVRSDWTAWFFKHVLFKFVHYWMWCAMFPNKAWNKKHLFYKNVTSSCVFILRCLWVGHSSKIRISNGIAAYVGYCIVLDLMQFEINTYLCDMNKVAHMWRNCVR